MISTPALKPPHWVSFSRSQVSSFVATLIDYALLFLLKEVFHVWYVTATGAGALAGAIANFLMNRHWSFQASHGQFTPQAIRYAVVSVGSLILNTAGVFLVTEYGHIHYAVSVVIVSLLIGFLFNYPLHRRYVYRIESSR